MRSDQRICNPEHPQDFGIDFALWAKNYVRNAKKVSMD